ncbi:uncharacterized protein YPO0396 [Kineococcus xinjiangensis]|uniref:Uncharacterized protein YPO0396 n=1 Tax=Kineococcus xinjiangensis TaxID=512762 RepID=A0A2S6IPJ3_9ACTN|nr:SbcC/MukB-like Walker B domain-containing protein [Kineococcus xinjiangensis]PPK96163.1 uncharacterized protein YPO0396 [Kineococcus xinjiangensis]
MSEALFSAPELEAPGTRSGFRLHRLEVLNWGTFDQQVWTLRVDGATSLLTGDIGSGKSTLVDAMTTLLVPAQRVSYNKAAGADTRERDLRSYVRGYHKRERHEETGTSRPVALRARDTYSVLLGVFVNPGLGTSVTLAQVFWLQADSSGTPERFFCVAGEDLSIAEHFTGFGPSVVDLRRRLRSRAEVFDHFPAYAREFRRRLGIPSEQALELFHQTVSMKSVGDLNEFVRAHMLEPFDADRWVTTLVSHFEDLTRAHAAVAGARAQLEELTPLLAEADAHDSAAAALARLQGTERALPYVLADARTGTLTATVDELTERATRLQAEHDETEHALARTHQRDKELSLQRAGHGGALLESLTAEAERLDEEQARRRVRAEELAELLEATGLATVTSAAQLAQRRADATAALAELAEREQEQEERRTQALLRQRRLGEDGQALSAELRSLQQRRTSIPSASQDLREQLCGELRLDAEDLPFVAELLRVRAEHAEWEGVAERVLHGFALSMLVPSAHYDAVAQWVNSRHLGTRLVYHQVPARLPVRAPVGLPEGLLLRDVVEIRSDTPFFAWLDSQLDARAAHACTTDVADFRRAERAVTPQGQVKHGGGRHEKDDRRAIGDRAAYVLGWSNESKIDALLARATGVQRQLEAVAEELRASAEAVGAARARRAALEALTRVDDFTELDHEPVTLRLADVQAQRDALEAGSPLLQRLGEEIATNDEERARLQQRIRALAEELGAARAERSRAERELTRARERLADPDAAALLAAHREEVLRRAGGAEPGDDTAERIRAALTRELAAERATAEAARRRAERRMAEFRQRHPHASHDMDTAIEAVGEYRALHARLTGDDLPRFERELKEILNTNTIRDIAVFSAQLHNQVEQIRERVATINDTLRGIDYSPGRYVRLDTDRTSNQEVREFIADLRACTQGTLDGDDEQYSEAKFLRVQRLIERFRGREGLTELDRAWAQRVTDVRRWVTFSASERWRSDDSEHETYTDSDGKSGGQKEKLAYTILAASLAYQFRLEWGVAVSKTFRFVVIDEAFGRGSDESTRYALDLFRRLGMQLLVVTPLQKVHVIEPYVAAVGFVDNPTGSSSRLQTLRIDDYRAQREAVDSGREE